MSTPVSVTAIISTYNEADIIGQVVEPSLEDDHSTSVAPLLAGKVVRQRGPARVIVLKPAGDLGTVSDGQGDYVTDRFDNLHGDGRPGRQA